MNTRQEELGRTIQTESGVCLSGKHSEFIEFSDVLKFLRKTKFAALFGALLAISVALIQQFVLAHPVYVTELDFHATPATQPDMAEQRFSEILAHKDVAHEIYQKLTSVSPKLAESLSKIGFTADEFAMLLSTKDPQKVPLQVIFGSSPSLFQARLNLPGYGLADSAAQALEAALNMVVEAGNKDRLNDLESAEELQSAARARLAQTKLPLESGLLRLSVQVFKMEYDLYSEARRVDPIAAAEIAKGYMNAPAGKAWRLTEDFDFDRLTRFAGLLAFKQAISESKLTELLQEVAVARIKHNDLNSQIKALQDMPFIVMKATPVLLPNVKLKGGREIIEQRQNRHPKAYLLILAGLGGALLSTGLYAFWIYFLHSRSRRP